MKHLFMALALAVASVSVVSAQEEPKQVGEKVERKDNSKERKDGDKKSCSKDDSKKKSCCKKKK